MNPIVTIDLGNSNPHYRVYRDNKKDFPKPLKSLNEDEVLHNKEAQFVISKVGELKPFLKNLGDRLISLENIRREQNFLDMPVHYTETLGTDRLYQAYQIYKKESLPSILIDVGTFITIDFITKEGFEGGFIFPGERTFLESYQKGARLPNMDGKNIDLNQQVALPHSTEDAILEASKSYLQNIYESTLSNKENYQIIMTGGGAEKHSLFVEKSFPKNSSKTDLYLIHDSLFSIFLEINSRPHRI